jgi:uncharacterized membrane protein YjfL (UPF0719 family)
MHSAPFFPHKFKFLESVILPGVMMVINVDNVVVGIVFTLVGVIVGLVCMVLAAVFAPKIVNLLTPAIDEEKEILKGNVAVARYFGGIIQSIIIGIAIIIAASIIAGMSG